MIENVITRGMWAFSPDDETVSHSITIYIKTNTFRRPRVTAETALSRVMGSGAAKAFIWSFEKQVRGSNEPLTVPLEPPVGGGLLPKLMAGVSHYTLNDVVSVTFGLLVSNMFANATCTVFIYPSPSLLDMILRPLRYLGGLISTDRETHEGMQMQGKDIQTALVYAKETGRIVHVHQNTWMQGASLPSEAQLRSSTLALAEGHTADRQADLDVLFTSQVLSPQKRYSVDVKEKRVIAT